MIATSTAELLDALRGRDIRLWREGENLRFSAPAGALTEELRIELSARKSEILASLESAAAPVLEPIPRVDRTAPLPLSFAQERLWIHNRIEPGLAVYNVPQCWRLRGPIEPQILARCLDEIARRHELLRTTIAPAPNAQAVQVIHPFASRELPVLECGGTSELMRLSIEEANRPFDLARGPLWRATLVRLSDEDHALLVTWHHLIFDAWSARIFARELETLYAAFLRGESSSLPELPIQYADFAQWQLRRFDSPRIRTQLDYWRSRLSPGALPLALPVDRARTSQPTYRGALVSRDLPAALLEGLRKLSQSGGATMFMTLLAAFKALLERTTGATDITIGTPIAQRPCVETESLIGIFLNMLVMRSDLAGDPNFLELLRRVRGTALEAFENQEVPFEKLVEELRPARTLHAHPFFQVAFVSQREEGPGFALPGVVVESFDAPGTTAKFDLTLFVTEMKSGLRATLEYSTDLFDEATIQRLLATFETLVSAIVANPETPLSRLPLLGMNGGNVPLISSISNAVAETSPADFAAPSDEVEIGIASLWTEVLGRNHLSLDDDFFLLGGHSIMAILLLDRLREKFAVDVPVRRLFETPTIRGLAEFVTERLPATPEKEFKSIVMIQRGDSSREPLFLVPGGWGGEIEFLVYAGLARSLDPRRPVYGLRVRGSNAEALPDKTVEEFATDFIAELCAFQPEGPYLLGGECVGGVIAYEMARQLIEAGKEVGVLLLLGTEWPNRQSLSEFVADERRRMWEQIWNTRVLGPARGHWQKLGGLSLREKWRYVWSRLRRGALSHPTAPAILERKILTEYPRRLMAHHLQPHGAKVTLVIDEELHRHFGAVGWDVHHRGELEVHVVPGDHISYIREHAPAAAEKIRAILGPLPQPASC